MKIAFASTDAKSVNEHFGRCETFYLYECTKTGYSFITVSEAPEEKATESDKLHYKIKCLQGADLVCMTQIGPKASTLVKSAGIFPMKASFEGQGIKEILQKLQALMQSAMPPLWLRQIMTKEP